MKLTYKILAFAWLISVGAAITAIMWPVSGWVLLMGGISLSCIVAIGVLGAY